MIPYTDFLYFSLLLYPLVPTLALARAGRLRRAWILLASLAMLLLVQYSGLLNITGALAVPEIWVLAAFAVLEWGVGVGFLAVRARTAARAPFYAAIALALLPLAVAKWLPLLAPGSALGFLGISYVTFRSLDVVFGVQDKLITRLPVGQYLAYLFFFPTISSGPIDRYRRFAADWQHTRTRAEFLQDLNGAVKRILTGFLYKFILAALIKQYWVDPVAGGTDLGSLAAYMYGYSLYLFFDFAGYSAFAIGLSYLFGIHTPENFNMPFAARNIRDFWNRWHISLSFWFRDHVYMRFLLAATKGKWFKSRYRASHLGLFISFGLMGLWHGTAWNYLAYGLYHAILLVGYDIFTRWNKTRKLLKDGPLWRLAGVVLTVQLVCLGFLLFSGRLNDLLSPPVPAQAAGSPPAQVVTTSPGFRGSLDTVSCTRISGWGWDSTRPDTAIHLDLLDGTTRLTTVIADRARDDLIARQFGNGRHAFTLAFPDDLKDNQPHEIHLRFAGTGDEVSESPKTVTCAP